MITWTDLNYCGDIVSQSYVALILKRLYLALVPIYFIFAYFFSIHFPKIILKRHPIFEKIAILSLITLSLATILTDAVVKNVEKKDWGFNIIPGNAINIFYFLVTIFILVILFNLIYKYFHLLPPDKLRIQYFIIGVIIYALFQSIFNIILPLVSGTKQYWQLGDFSAIFLIGFTAYAIAKHSLFGIRAILAGLLVGILAILLFLDAVVLTQEPSLQIIKWVILAVFLFFGYYLVRSVLREVQLRKSLQHAYADLKQLDTAKSEFISVASHQLRTPLSAIKGYVSMMRKGDYGDVSPDMAEALAVLHESNERLVVLVNNMLNISRIESGRLQFKPRAMAIEPIIANMVNELTPEANGAGVRLIYRKPSAPAREIFADPGLVHEILINLVDNGIKYTQRGGKVVVSLRPAERFLRTEIKDSGIGVVPETIPALFKKFSRGQSGAKMHTNGAGLGLYIVKELVNLHKGQVGVTSAGSGKGSTFWFELPYDIM